MPSESCMMGSRKQLLLQLCLMVLSLSLILSLVPLLVTRWLYVQAHFTYDFFFLCPALLVRNLTEDNPQWTSHIPSLILGYTPTHKGIPGRGTDLHSAPQAIRSPEETNRALTLTLNILGHETKSGLCPRGRRKYC